ncbi:MAG: HAD-IIIC family phosphatase [Acidobacteria bacterium]|nr:HAD-IIIC family phosphatase [Acidobacteriota bacterium]
MPARALFVKCVVWDLDNTLWDGILLEDAAVTLRPAMARLVRIFDERGILQSVASRGDHDLAMKILNGLGLREYFLLPHVRWGAKSQSIRDVAESLRLGLDAFAFVDDDPAERAEVAAACPEVWCIAAEDLAALAESPRLLPPASENAPVRRQMYLQEEQRRHAEEAFAGPQEEFLATLQMRLTIEPAAPRDLRRVEELIIRTHQLNSTGYSYTYDELARLCDSPAHLVLIASLEDRFGGYGRIGLAVVDCDRQTWTIKLLLMSCRVIARGIGSIMMTDIMQRARARVVRLRAEFLPSDRNRLMYVAFKCAGFRETAKVRHALILEHDLSRIPPYPAYVTLESRQGIGA